MSLGHVQEQSQEELQDGRDLNGAVCISIPCPAAPCLGLLQSLYLSKIIVFEKFILLAEIEEMNLCLESYSTGLSLFKACLVFGTCTSDALQSNTFISWKASGLFFQGNNHGGQRRLFKVTMTGG